MPRRGPLLAPLVLGIVLLTGCEAPESPPTRATTRAATPAATPEPASRPDDASVEKRARIAGMYAGYRAGAFADAAEIEPGEIGAGLPDGAVLLVDCREDRERDVSMIEGAISRAEFEADAARYRDRVIVTYCTIGYRSGHYTKTLTDRGFNAKNLVGGVLGWAHDGRPFVDEDGSPTRRVHVYGAEWDLLPGTHESVYEGKSPP